MVGCRGENVGCVCMQKNELTTYKHLLVATFGRRNTRADELAVNVPLGTGPDR